MSCSTCNCNPCQCNCSCDPENEALSSAFTNFTDDFIGPIEKSCVDGEVVWTLPCGLQSDSPVTGIPKLADESIFCYFLRVLQILAGDSGGFQPLCDVLTSLCALGFPADGEFLTSDGVGGLEWAAQSSLCDYLNDICGLTLAKGDILYTDASGDIKNLAIGSNGEYLTNVGGIPAYQSIPGVGSAFLVSDLKGSAVAGGTFTSGAWQTRDLNTISYDPDGVVVSIAGNQLELLAGTYLLWANAPAYQVNVHQKRLINVTDVALIQDGPTELCSTGGGDNIITGAAFFGVVTVVAGKKIELQHRCQTSQATNGFGLASAFGSGACFAQIQGIKIA